MEWAGHGARMEKRRDCRGYWLLCNSNVIGCTDVAVLFVVSNSSIMYNFALIGVLT
jgi:hypothetical protein